MRRSRFAENYCITLDVSFALICSLSFLICHLLHQHPVTLLRVKLSLNTSNLSSSCYFDNDVQAGLQKNETSKEL